MTPICEYLTKEILPADKKKSRVIRRKVASPITSPWLFNKWGIDIAEPFSEGPGKVKFLIVAVDYFTKWIKAKPVATITGNQVKKFVWDNIVCRFGLPGEIVSDNGKQFRDNPFKDWCEKLCIRQCFASVKHPQTNGLVERANRSLGEGIKARLDERSKDWIEELSHVLWSHRTMIKSSNEKTPFSLTYGTEAVIPAEIGMPMLRTMEVDPTKNNEALEVNLDLIEEKGNKQQFKKQKAKLKWKSITTLRSAAQVSGQVTWSTAVTTQVTPEMVSNLDPNGNDRTKLQNHLEKEHTDLKIAKETNSRRHGTFVILKSVMYTKCKNPPGTYDDPKGNISIYLYLVMY
ncbi:reverse transcriptase domain-containing protein [Tanacetum coccineum]|uniref:Reverse transcriptase domain-containing protein n=1 Tax=Tanacetum coccineum TaxID=301880 RepID=A0ABQ5GV14_9ASTR